MYKKKKKKKKRFNIQQQSRHQILQSVNGDIFLSDKISHEEKQLTNQWEIYYI